MRMNALRRQTVCSTYAALCNFTSLSHESFLTGPSCGVALAGADRPFLELCYVRLAFDEAESAKLLVHAKALAEGQGSSESSESSLSRCHFDTV